MNVLDIILLSIIAIFFLVGIWRGLVKQLFSIIAVIGGIIVGFIFYNVAAEQLLSYNLTDDTSVAAVLGFILIAVIYYIIIQIIAWFLTRMIGTLKLGWANRLAGGALGILLGVVASHVAVIGLTFFTGVNNPAIQNSKVLPYVKEGYAIIDENIPEEFKSFFDRSGEIIEEKIENTEES